jgi:DNA-directed RNA polymerase specialized sigma24 family protein
MPAKFVETVNTEQPVVTCVDRLSDKDDPTLVAAAKHGNLQAFEVLVERHQSRICAVAWRFARAAEDTEDIAQQTFQKAFLHLKWARGIQRSLACLICAKGCAAVDRVGRTERGLQKK